MEVLERSNPARAAPSRDDPGVSVEAGSMIGWDRYVGDTGTKIGMHTFGSSAPLKDLLKKFGFTPEEVLAAAREQLEGRGDRRHE